MENNNFYITTTLPYINSDPHIGFAAEIIKADVIARYMSKQGKNVIFNTGTDEHGLKIYQKAEELKMPVQEYCDLYSAKFLPLKDKFNLSYNKFIRTTDKNHEQAAQAFWNLCKENGDIYKKSYKVKYCVGCEMEKTDSELDKNGFCSLHPNRELEVIEEENYFFRFSKYQNQLIDLYTKNPDFVKPASRLKEIKTFVEGGLQDFSISRVKEKMPHGVPVPDDSEQVMYVWFDALVNYVSTLGWPNENSEFSDFWPGVQVCGKDNLRPQAAMWQAMLMSAGIPNSLQILVFGFLTINGEKISKSTGNVIDPYELAEKYNTDAIRYYLLSEISTFEDGDYSEEKFRERYNSDLANGLGNLVARVSNMLEKNEIETDLKLLASRENASVFLKEYNEAFKEFRLNECLQIIWEKIKKCDERLSNNAPWKMTDKKEIEGVLLPIAQDILNISEMLWPFMPSTADIIINSFREKNIKKTPPLFPRLV